MAHPGGGQCPPYGLRADPPAGTAFFAAIICVG